MKKLFILILFMLVFATGIFPQPHRLDNINQEYENNDQLIDYNNITATLDDPELYVSKIRIDWNDTDWIYDWRSIVLYDGNNNQIERISQDWVGDSWLNEYRTTSSYDVNNNRTLALLEQWSFPNWINYYQNSYTYDDNNNRIQWFSQDWENGAWVNRYLRTDTYDANNNVIEHINQEWLDSTWVNNYRRFYSYDTNNNLIGYFTQHWHDSVWVNYYLNSYTYDDNYLREELSQYWEDSTWVNNGRDSLYYDVNYNNIRSIEHHWIDSIWVNFLDAYNTYDENNNRIERLTYTAPSPNYTFQLAWWGLYYYNDNNDLIENIWYNRIDDEWINSYRDLFLFWGDPPHIKPINDYTILEDSTLFVNPTISDYTDEFYISAVSDPDAVAITVQNDTLVLIPDENWNGNATITVYASNSASDDSSSESFSLTVTPINDEPAPYSLIYPTSVDTFSTHTDSDTLIEFRWSQSRDPDNDVIYSMTIYLEFFGNTYTDEYDNISDTILGISSNTLDILLSALSLDVATLFWYTWSSDSQYTTYSDTGSFVLMRSVLSSDNENILPTVFALHKNYPNPFNPITTLRYDLPENGHVNIIIYDMLGRQVKTLMDQTQDAGYRSIIWDATNDYGKPVSAGIYLYQIQAGEHMQTKKMVLLK